MRLSLLPGFAHLEKKRAVQVLCREMPENGNCGTVFHSWPFSMSQTWITAI